MARIEWAQLCELAFLDSYERLCLIGVTTRLPVPWVPVTLRQLMIAMRVVDAEPGEELTVGVSFEAPGRPPAVSAPSEGFEVTIVAEYVLITLWNVPFREIGCHRFAVSLGDQVVRPAVQIVRAPQPLPERSEDVAWRPLPRNIN